MGFGDVVLIGFLGVFTGWQGVTILFFLAPFAGLVFGILRILFRANREIPYGPFLCLATLFLLFFWREIEEITRPLRNGPTVAIVLAVMAVLMAILLLVLQGIKAVFSHFFR